MVRRTKEKTLNNLNIKQNKITLKSPLALNIIEISIKIIIQTYFKLKTLF